MPFSVFAQSVSPHYEVNETQFGSGGEFNLSSPNYGAQGSLGGSGGTLKSTNYTNEPGFLTPNEPFLQMIINTSTVNLGTLSTSTAATGVATFQVRAYVDSGYTVLTMSNPPTTSGGAVLAGMTSTAASAPGTEQFGINLRANTSPATFGADPSPQPDSTFAAGQAASGYNTPNQFKYVKGNAIAGTGASGWGQTNYTISYIANINSVTKAGQYSMVHDLVVVATF